EGARERSKKCERQREREEGRERKRDEEGKGERGRDEREREKPANTIKDPPTPVKLSSYLFRQSGNTKP
ncbi:uncharacterized protein LOC132824823, partial [Hemiscyllium ocellatum]|uniref:uncharacterized protein LOC132824823 n=1 Tax=Hemiscyllium ocellatum TaxID=170820 RepID=UPI002966A246